MAELKKWMRTALQAGKELAEKYPDHSYIAALRELTYEDFQELQYMNDFEFSTFYEAGFLGREPEYVKAIRYGKIPECGQSTNWAEHKYENGVSCIKIIREEDDENMKSIYDVTLGFQGMEKMIIEGWYLGGYGSDGEPLLLCPVEVK